MRCILSNFSLSNKLERINQRFPRIYATADQQGAKARDYACTFLGVVASPSATLLMQIGDGGIVVDVGNGLEVPITPMIGEYANL